MRKISKIGLIGLLGLIGLMGEAHAQADRGQLRDGNRSYKKEKYDKAEVQYRRALEQDSMDYRGQFNLGNTLYRQKKYDEAARHFDRALQCPDVNDRQRSRALHNKGNSYLKAGIEAGEQGMQMFQQAVENYQESLKLDPKNEDTRYNLAYARRLLQQAQQQQQQNQQNQNQDQNQQNKDNKNQQNQEGQNQQNQQNQPQQDQQNKDQKGQQGQNPQGDEQEEKDKGNQKRPNKMEQRRQDAERMLEAVKNNERQSLKDQQKKVQVGTVKHSDKDW